MSTDTEFAIRRKQMAVDEQSTVLTSLAQSVARPGFRMLEVGSWCGDSAVVLGRVAKRNGGLLFCVDWWKGNVGTDLARIAGTSDVFSVFWKRIKDEGLEDTIIPIRGRSDDVHSVLAKAAFDLIYLDGDHRYEPVSKDIAHFAPLVGEGGVLCGDDCEGRIEDFEMDFLRAGQAEDFRESVHCGVVLAVGETFKDYSIDYNVWSVRRTGDNWVPANPDLGDIPKKRQFPPPLIESIGVYNIVRYGRKVYAIPHALGNVDITDSKARDTLNLLSADSLTALKKMVMGAERGLIVGLDSPLQPQLIGKLAGFNLVKLGTEIYAINRGLGHVDLSHRPKKPVEGMFHGTSIPQLLLPILLFRLKRLFKRILG